ncbi:unnamed protein product [Callosobruchus maculatus]|uniref:Uncharacterized protein n=1 Tax=Callosobruchus maculatus TaxID=64391 RepID=A0A653DV88_CALMS|nr:unnamed protein product [Callosobruchus maculatus]
MMMVETIHSHSTSAEGKVPRHTTLSSQFTSAAAPQQGPATVAVAQQPASQMKMTLAWVGLDQRLQLQTLSLRAEVESLPVMLRHSVTPT